MAVSLFFLKLDIQSTAVLSTGATGKGRRTKVELDWLLARVSTVPKPITGVHQRQATEGDA